MAVEFGQSGPYPVCARGIDRVERTFYAYVVREMPQQITVRAYVGQEPGTDDFFELGAEEVSGERWQIVTLDHRYDPRFEKVGLPEACIRLLGRILGRPVVSSSELYPAGPGEFRTEAATKAWERLVSVGEARYDSSADRFELVEEGGVR